MDRRERIVAVFDRTAELLGLTVREAEAFGQPHLKGEIEGYAVSVTARSGGMLGSAYRVRFLVIADPASLPKGFRAERWSPWHRLARWTPEPTARPVAGFTASDRPALDAWLTTHRRGVLAEACAEIPGFVTTDGLFAGEHRGEPMRPPDVIDPLEHLVATVRSLTA